MKIKELRANIGLSQAELAEKLGKNQTAIGKYERGDLEPNIETLKALSSIFGVSVGYLIGAEDDFGNVEVSGEILSQEEKDLITCYRALDFDARNVIRIQLKALVESKA